MQIELADYRGLTITAEFDSGSYEITGPPSCGKTVMRHGIADWMEGRIESWGNADGVTFWPTGAVDQNRFVHYLCGTEAKLNSFPDWFVVRVLRASVENFWRSYEGVLSKTIPHAPNASIIRIIKERLTLAEARAKASMAELDSSTDSPLPDEELKDECQRIRLQIQKLSRLEQDLDAQGRHEDAEATFESRINMQARFRQIEGTLLDRIKPQGREARQLHLETSLQRCVDGLVEADRLSSSLAGAYKQLSSTLIGEIKQRTGLNVQIDPGGQLFYDRPYEWLSDSEKVGIRSAISVTLMVLTGFPTCFLEGSSGDKEFDLGQAT